MRHDSIDQAVNGRVQERTGLEYQQYAQGLAEAVEQQQAASRAAVHWREVLDKTEDRHARRYFEGMVQLSTLKALALAGGLNATARKHQAVIIRKDAAGQQHQVIVDLGKLLKQETEDVKLQASDVLYVPQSGTKTALIRAAEVGLGIGTAVAIFRVGQRN